MTDCLNETMRDQLPELAHGLLAAHAAAGLRAHVASCASCAAELAALETARLVLQASAPRIAVAAIAQAVTRAVPTQRPALRVERGGPPAPAVARRAIWRSRQFLAAAASLLIVASVAIPVLNGARGVEPGVSAPDTAVVAVRDTPTTAAPASAQSSFAVSEGLADLSNDDLSTLLAELDGVEATIAAEPYSLRPPLVDTPEGGY
jgi:anti-sigma factor RsiW